MVRKIIIDTDPGQDDAVAILLALASPEDLDVLGLTTVAGNVPLWRTTENARKIVELSGRTDVPVHAGCARPMMRKPVTAEHVHGETGLNGIELPPPSVPQQAQHGIDFIIETARSLPDASLTLCTLGPLTNVAMALVQAPDIAGKIREVVSMGGAYFEVGNITPAAEFNIYVDPEAAAVVLESGIPVTLLPLDVTHQVLSTAERLDRFKALGNRCGTTVAALLSFSERFDLEKYGWAGAPLHDPNVIAYLLDPSIYQGRHINVAVETASPLTLGMTVADYWRVTKRTANCTYIRSADADRFFDLLTDRLARLP